jgi:hypothetical protein
LLGVDGEALRRIKRKMSLPGAEKKRTPKRKRLSVCFDDFGTEIDAALKPRGIRYI